ncbi:MAG: Rrf2 family transcriptional regulator [Acidobacteriota bacterium]
MKITATEEYGLRLLLQLAGRRGDTVSLAELAEAEGVPGPVAAKVLLRLRRAGLVAAARGRNGGYALAVAPEGISVARALRALGTPLFHSTFCRPKGRGSREACLRLANCSLRPVWSHLDTLLEAVFSQLTLAHLLAGEDTTRSSLAALRLPGMTTAAPGGARERHLQ